jgi:hypothetical protein
VGVKFLALKNCNLNTDPNCGAGDVQGAIANWEDAAYPAPATGLTAHQADDNIMHWYQNVPQQAGWYYIIPRVFTGFTSANDPRLDGATVIAEGVPFVFCVGITQSKCNKAPFYANTASKSATPDMQGSVAAADEFEPGLSGAPVCDDSVPPVAHHYSGPLDVIVNPASTSDGSAPEISGTFQFDGFVPCETLDAGIGTISSFTVDAPGLEFQFQESFEFERVGSALVVAVFGTCTSVVGSGPCDLEISGVWVPSIFMTTMKGSADLSSGTFLITYHVT